MATDGFHSCCLCHILHLAFLCWLLWKRKCPPQSHTTPPHQKGHLLPLIICTTNSALWFLWSLSSLSVCLCSAISEPVPIWQCPQGWVETCRELLPSHVAFHVHEWPQRESSRLVFCEPLHHHWNSAVTSGLYTAWPRQREQVGTWRTWSHHGEQESRAVDFLVPF